MSHYRAVMGTTVDCEDCPYDTEEKCTADYCVLFYNSKEPEKQYTIEQLEEMLRNAEPFMFEW